MKPIAVVGAGAAGSMIVAELLRRPASSRTGIVWFRGRQHVGRGVAYATSADEHLLNVRSAGLGLHADAPGEFRESVQDHDRRVRASDFLPRRLYGEYLQASVQRSLDHAAARGHAIELIDAEARSLRQESDALVVEDDGGRRHEVAQAVLAVGALPPRTLACVQDDAWRSGRYRSDPWHLPEDLAPPKELLVLGSGLTAVDVILSAAARWPDARMTVLSRHGVLPAQHNDEPAAPSLRQAYLHEALLDTPRVRAWVGHVREALRSEPGVDWRALVDGLRAATPALWASLDATERGRFLRHVRWAWEISRHRMPPATARQIAALRESGRLRLIAGQAEHVSGNGPLTVYWRPRSRRRPERLEVDLAVQATGLDTDVRNTDHALVRQLVDEKYLAADPLGLGVRARENCQVVRPDGTPWPGVHVLGSLLRAEQWECTGLPEIRAGAQRIAAALRVPPPARLLGIVGGHIAQTS
jgi:uncharacterized NAD(P)/FAD-binding protein YdhS